MESEIDNIDSVEENTPILEESDPPILDLQNDNSFVSNGQDLSSITDVSSYDVNEIKEEEINKEKRLEKRNDDVRIEIPTATDDNGIVENNKEVINPEELKKTKNKKTIKIKKSDIIKLSLMIIVFGAGLFCGKVFFSTTTLNSTVSSNNKTSSVSSNGAKNTTKVNNYIYNIPTQYSYDKSNNGLLIYNLEENYRLMIKGVAGTYEYLSGAKKSIKESLKNKGLTVNNIKELIIGDTNYIVFEVIDGSYTYLYAFRKGLNEDLFYIEVYSANGLLKYESLDVAEEILKNAKYEETSNDLERVKISDNSELIIYTANEYKKLID